MSPNSLKNLKPPYPPGVSGNEGSGNGYSLKAELKHALRDKEKRKELIDSTIAGAILREPTPFKEVWDRVEGKVPGDVPPSASPGSQVLNIIVVGGGDNLKDILAQVKERTKKLAIGEG